jgi:hypothetical protein
MHNRTLIRLLRNLALLLCTLFVTSSCSMIPRNITDSGVEIERVSTPSGYIKSANLWEDRNGISLRGSVSDRPVSKKTYLPGHIDISITEPDRGNTVCTTTMQKNIGRKKQKPFSLQLETLPAPGSVVRVWHHKAREHDCCMAPRSRQCDS